MPVINEHELEEHDLPGRLLKWIIPSDGGQSSMLSMCVVRISPGQTVNPAHAHPNGEEAIYVISGQGEIMIDDEVLPVEQGSTILLPQGSVHMLRNTGDDELKAVCFYTPPSDLSTYRFYEDVAFPE